MPDDRKPKQLTELAELIGKTIERTVSSSGNEDQDYLGIFFADGSFLRISIDTGFDPQDAYIVWNREPTGWIQLRAFGLMSEEEYARKTAKADAFLVENRRREYERLKAEFEPEDKPNA